MIVPLQSRFMGGKTMTQILLSSQNPDVAVSTVA